MKIEFEGRYLLTTFNSIDKALEMKWYTKYCCKTNTGTATSTFTYWVVNFTCYMVPVLHILLIKCISSCSYIYVTYLLELIIAVYSC